MQRTDQPPTLREIAELTTRLRTLTTPGCRADPRERTAFLADKATLLARISTNDEEVPAAHRPPTPQTATRQGVITTTSVEPSPRRGRPQVGYPT